MKTLLALILMASTSFAQSVTLSVGVTVQNDVVTVDETGCTSRVCDGAQIVQTNEYDIVIAF